MGCGKPLIFQRLLIKAVKLTLKVRLQAFKFSAWGFSDHSGNVSWTVNLSKECFVTISSQLMSFLFYPMPGSEIISFPCWFIWCEAWEGLEGVGSKESFFFSPFISTLRVVPLWTPFYVGELWHLLISANPVPKQAVKAAYSQVLLDLQMPLARSFLTFCWPIWISALNQCLAPENSTLSLPLMLILKNILFIF